MSTILGFASYDALMRRGQIGLKKVELLGETLKIFETGLKCYLYNRNEESEDKKYLAWMEVNFPSTIKAAVKGTINLFFIDEEPPVFPNDNQSLNLLREWYYRREDSVTRKWRIQNIEYLSSMKELNGKGSKVTLQFSDAEFYYDGKYVKSKRFNSMTKEGDLATSLRKFKRKFDILSNSDEQACYRFLDRLTYTYSKPQNQNDEVWSWSICDGLRQIVECELKKGEINDCGKNYC